MAYHVVLEVFSIFQFHRVDLTGLVALADLLNGGLQGHMEIVHACQLHRLIYALGCQRVSSEDGIGVPGKQHWGDVRLAKARREQASESLATGWGRGCGRPGALWEMLYLNSSFAIDVQSWMDHLQGHGLSA